jgi:hypothetical protein
MTLADTRTSMSDPEALFTAFLHAPEEVKDAILAILTRNGYCNIRNDPIDNRECFSWCKPYERNNDPLVLECINNIIKFTKENPLGAPFLNKYYTCVGNLVEAGKWILSPN